MQTPALQLATSQTVYNAPKETAKHAKPVNQDSLSNQEEHHANLSTSHAAAHALTPPAPIIGPLKPQNAPNAPIQPA